MTQSPHNMSNTPVQDPLAQEVSTGSVQTLPSRPFQPVSDPSASKRVCFYKSGDYKFSGHRMVINVRTFKTYDALLDALSKKVPLPFGVRTITTPRGTHPVRTLDDLHDGGSYVCSDQKRVKPLNLDEVNRRQVPWNATRPFSSRQRRRQDPHFGRGNYIINRPKVTERVAVRTPKKLLVINNRDATVKRTIVLQRRTAPTFDALLDYLSQMLQFPVLKLYSTDGRRVDGLSALILCSGVVVAAGNEPFRLGNYSFHRTGAMAPAMFMDTVEPSMLQPGAQNNKSFSSGRGSRNFSISSERYIVDQVNKSRNGSMNGQLHHHNGSFEAEVKHRHKSVDAHGTRRLANEQAFIMPHEDDIEKSFRVNQDGSMTVEMKVHLTIQEEEVLHWTTTLSRSSLSARTLCASISGSGNSSPDSNNAFAKATSSINKTKERNIRSEVGKGVNFNSDRDYEGYTSTALEKAKAGFKRTPTPGPRHVKASLESVRMMTESGVQESTLGHYSYMERTADGETSEGYCLVRHSSSSSNRPIPKPRKTASAGAGKKGSHSSDMSSGVAEVLQIQNNGMDVTETVMHICESQSFYDNYYGNEEYSTGSVPLPGSTAAPESKPSTLSSSDDCDIDFSTTDSLQRQEMLSLSSEPITLTHEVMNNLSPVSEARAATNSQTVKKDKTPKSETKKKINPSKGQKSSTSTSSSEKKQKDRILSPSKRSKHSSSDKLGSNASVGKKSLSSSESGKNGQKGRGAEKIGKDEKMPGKEQASIPKTSSMKRTPSQRQTLDKAAVAPYNGHNINNPTKRPPMTKSILDILQPKKTGKKTISKPKSMIENKMSSPKKSLELSESFSMPSLNPSPSEVHQYVENWLEKVNPDPGPYTEESITDKSEPQTTVVFQIGADSESDEKNGYRTDLDEHHPSSGDAVKRSASFLSVPPCHAEPATALLHNEQYAKGLCVSMPSVRVDPEHQENRLRAHKSAEAINPADSDSASSTSNLLSPKEKIKPVLQQLCSSMQCIRRESNTNASSNLVKSHSVPDFPTQVAAVFGSSCKAFLSFLSVMTLRDNLAENQPRSTSEAMLMMASLKKMSAIEDEEEQRASLTDLQSRASSQLRERWKDFQILRERLESEPLSPRISETEFALDVVSEGGDAFEDRHSVIDELMEELNMPQDLRAEISSTIAKTFYPVEESTILEPERNQSDSEEDVEKFVEECDDGTKQSPEPDNTCTAEDITQTKQVTHNIEQANTMTETEHTNDEVQDAGIDVKSDTSESLKGNENEEDNREIEDMKGLKGVEEDGDANGTDDDDGAGEETEIREREEEGPVSSDNGAEEWEAEKGTEEEMTDDREGVEETEQEENEEDEVDEEADEEENGEGEFTEVKKGEEVEDGADGETDETEEVEEVEGEEAEESSEEEEEGEMMEVIEEKDEEEEEEEMQNNTEEMEEDAEEEKREDISEDDHEEDVEENKEERKVEVSEESNEEEEEREQDEVDDVEVTDEEEREQDEVEDVEVRDEEEEREQDEVEDVEVRDEEEKEEEEEREQDDVDDVEVRDEEEEEEREQDEVEDGEVRDEEEKEEEEREQDDVDNVEVTDEKEEEEEEREQDEVEDVEIRDEEEKEEEREALKNIDEEETWEDREESRKEQEQAGNGLEEESVEEEDVVEELEIEENTKAERVVQEEEREDDDEVNESDQVEERDSKDKEEEEKVSDGKESIAGYVDHKNLLQEASYLQQQSEEEAPVAKQEGESETRYSSEGQCEDDKGNGTDAVTETETDEGGETHRKRSGSLPHPVEISQELLDFVNAALQSSSLIFTYDAHGKVRVEPDNALVVQTKQNVIPKRREDSSYGRKRLPSPMTSDLSDYRPETSESGGYKTQESVDIVTDSGEEASEKPSQTFSPKTDMPNRRTTAERAHSELSTASNSLQNSRLKSNSSSFDSGTKVSKEDLSYFSAASSQKADTVPAIEAARSVSSGKDSTDGVLIDKGRWLLKENHLIRNSPPISLGMYGNADSTCTDTSQENMAEESPSHNKSQLNPLAAISSSELEEMAKPKSPKCTYYNMSHGSDSDPFLDDSSCKSARKDTSSVKGRGFKVSPSIDTSKTWTNKNGSLSSFASVEFKIQDRKVHPEGESSAVTQPRRTSSGRRDVLQAQDSLETLPLRCGQYCPIL